MATALVVEDIVSTIPSTNSSTTEWLVSNNRKGDVS